VSRDGPRLCLRANSMVRRRRPTWASSGREAAEPWATDGRCSSDLLSIPHSGAGLFRRCVGSVAWQARKGKHFREARLVLAWDMVDNSTSPLQTHFVALPKETVDNSSRLCNSPLDRYEDDDSRLMTCSTCVAMDVRKPIHLCLHCWHRAYANSTLGSVSCLSPSFVQA
jgi:hypothetical protein